MRSLFLDRRYEFCVNELEPGDFIDLWDHQEEAFLTTSQAKKVVTRLTRPGSNKRFISEHILKYGDFPL